MKTLYAVVVAAAVVACASVKPVAVQVGDRCLRCRQPVGDLRLAGEIIDNMRAPFPFRTAGCMAKFVKANPDQGITAIFVTDYRTGRMVQAADAWFVPTEIAAPKGKRTVPDYLAFGSRGDAEAARAAGTPLLRWSQVVAEASGN
jgi:hypothetical protein